MEHEYKEFKKKIARAVSSFCKGKGITHQEIANRMNLSKSQVDNWFSQGNFSARGIRVLKEDFGVPGEIFEKGEYTPVDLTTDALARLVISMQRKIEELELRIRELEKK